MKSKKSLIIAPALAALFVAAAGSVSGTVAWFSSVRVFQTDVANFSVVETDGSLACVMNEGQGTTKSGNIINVNDDTVLTHGSFNHTSGVAYVVDEETGNTYVSKSTDSNAVGFESDSWLHKGSVDLLDNGENKRTVNVYNAVSWSMTFTYTFAGDKSPVGIFLDLGKSVFTELDSGSPYDFTKTGTLDTAKGFRVAFYGAVNATAPNQNENATDRRNVVWGNHAPITESVPDAYATTGAAYTQNESSVVYEGTVYTAKETIAAPAGAFDKSKWQATGDIANPYYVSSTSLTSPYNPNANTKDYVVTNTIEAENPGAYTRVEASTETQVWSNSCRPERLCVLTPTNNSVTVKCAAWFEGTDPNVVTGAAMKCLSARINVYARALIPTPVEP